MDADEIKAKKVIWNLQRIFFNISRRNDVKNKV